MIRRQEWLDVSLITIITTYLSMFKVDDSFDAIQIKCDREVSHGAFVFVDKCKPIMFCFFVHNLLNSWMSFIATKLEEQQILLIQQSFFWLNLFKAAE